MAVVVARLEKRRLEESQRCYSTFSESLTTFLNRHGWRNPMTLYNAIEDRQSVFDLLREAARETETGLRLGAWEKEIWDWYTTAGNSITRIRDRIVSSDCEERRSYEIRQEDEQNRQQLQDVIHQTALTACTHNHWRVRKGQSTDKPVDLEGRAAVEQRDRLRWVAKVVAVLVEANLPVVAQAGLTMNPQLALERAVGKRRARTMRNRIRTWNKVRLWLSCVHQEVWPSSAAHMVDYLEDLARGGCGKTVPAAVAAALAFLEKIGAVSSSQMISRNAMYINTTDVIVMQAQQNSAAVKKAPSMLIAVLISMELYVCDASKPRYKRGIAWTKLIKNWTSMRFDDLMGVDPQRMSLSSQCWRGIITRSKVSGPGKPTLELPVFCHAKAGFTGNDWLRTGYEIWSTAPFNFPRDYFLPRPSKDWRSVVQRSIDYSEGSGFGRSLLLELEIPERRLSGGWQLQAGTQLVPAPGHMFWSEHGDRNLAPSIAAAIGSSEDDRDYLGRWGVNQGRSHTYVATARQIVLKLQAQICGAICEGPGSYDEFDVLEQYRVFLAGRVPADQIAERLRITQVLVRDGTSWCLQQPWPMNAAGDDEAEELVTVEDLGSTAQALILPTTEDEASETPFWISVSKSGFRRLHRWDGCRVDRAECWSWKPIATLSSKDMAPTADKACKFCWPEGVSASDSRSDSDGSSSGSSSDSTESESQETA
jgi:hypothetical protein